MTITRLNIQAERLDSPNFTVVFAQCLDGLGLIPSMEVELSVNHVGTGYPLSHFSSLRGKSAAMFATDNQGNERQYAGVIQRLSAQLTDDGKVSGLRLQLLGWPHSQMGYQKGYRFFQDQSAVDIATSIFQSPIDTVSTEHVLQAPPAKPYVVQFGESDTDFVTRVLLADKLLFRVAGRADANGRNFCAKLHLMRNLSALPLAAQALTFTSTHSQRPGSRSGIFDLYVDYPKAPDVLALTAHSTAQPNVDLRVSTPVPPSAGASGQWMEVVAEAGFDSAADGQALAELMLKARRAPRYGFRCNLLGISAGITYPVTGLPQGMGLSTQLALVWARQTFTKDDLGGWTLVGDFLGVLPDDPYEPTLPAAPQVPGLLRGVAVAKANGTLTPNYAQLGNDDTVDTDKFGRIRVRILWPGQARRDATHTKDAPWLRLMTPWAGQRAGFFALPRAGQEVIISFIQGDPAQPVVLGCVYGESDNTPAAPPWSPSAVNQWVGLGTRAGNEAQQYLRLDASAAPDSNQGVELHSASQMRLVATKKSILNAPAIEIGSSSDQKTTSININTDVYNVDATQASDKSSSDWSHKQSSKTTFHAEFKTGASTYEVVAAKGSVVGLAQNMIGMKIDTTGLKIDTTAVNIKNNAIEHKLSILNFANAIAKNDGAVVKTENTGVSSENKGIETKNLGLENTNSGVAISTGGLNLNVNAFSTYL